MNPTLPIGLVLCAAVGAVLWLWPGQDRALSGAPGAVVLDAKPTPQPEAATLNARWVAPPTVSNPDAEAKHKLLRLPNGTYVAALNGAVDPAPLSWPNDRPYSEIIGIERSPVGQDWWVHADGAKSTTVMAYRSDLGRHDAVTQLAIPTTPMPMEPGEVSRIKGQ